jgi:hypothetical protein
MLLADELKRSFGPQHFADGPTLNLGWADAYGRYMDVHSILYYRNSDSGCQGEIKRFLCGLDD